MKINLLTYADKLFADQQSSLVLHARTLGVFDEIYTKTREHLIETEFYYNNKDILDGAHGGYCCWKPYFILETLSRMEEGDLLLYMDAADWVANSTGMREEIINEMQNKDLLLTAGAFPNRMYTKRDCFVLMNCDEEKYWDAIQLEAGVMIIKKTDYTKRIINQWARWCRVAAIITDDANVCGKENIEGFVAGRYDQSVLTNVALINNIQPSGFIRKFVTCNFVK